MDKDTQQQDAEIEQDSDADLLADAATELRAMDLPTLADAVERATRARP